MVGMSKRNPPSHRALWIGASLLAVLAAVLTFDQKLYINGDNADYMLLARRMVEGEIWPEGRFPPLFPALLAGVQGLFGEGLIAQKMLVLIFYAGSVLVLWRLIARRTVGVQGPWLLLASATLIPLVEFSHYVMSEIPYLFLLLGALDAADRILVDRNLHLFGHGVSRTPSKGAAPCCTRGDRSPAAGRVRTAVELALWIAAAFYMRSAGITVAAGILACLVAAGKRRHAVVTAGALALLMIPWIVRSATQTGGSPYIQQILLVNPLYPEFGTLTPEHLWGRIRDNSIFYFREQIPCLLFPALYRSTYSRPGIRDAAYPLWISLPLLVPLAVGLARGLRRVDPMAWVAATGLGLTLLWPWIWRGSRFLVPVLPPIFILWWSGWGAWTSRATDPVSHQGKTAPVRGSRSTPGSPWRWIRPAIIAVILLLGVRNLILYADETRRHPQEWEHYFTALEWIRDNTPPGAVVIDRKPGFVELVARREALNFPREEDPARMLAFLRQRGAHYVVIPSLPFDDIARFLVPAVGQSRPFFDVVFSLPAPEVYVLRFFPEGGRGEPGLRSPGDAGAPAPDPRI